MNLRDRWTRFRRRSIDLDIFGNYAVASGTVLVSIIAALIIIIASDLSVEKSAVVLILGATGALISKILHKTSGKTLVRSATTFDNQTDKVLNELYDKLHDDLKIMSTDDPDNPDMDKLRYALDRVDKQIKDMGKVDKDTVRSL